jgi:hypothetical protein
MKLMLAIGALVFSLSANAFANSLVCNLTKSHSITFHPETETVTYGDISQGFYHFRVLSFIKKKCAHCYSATVEDSKGNRYELNTNVLNHELPDVRLYATINRLPLREALCIPN